MTEKKFKESRVLRAQTVTLDYEDTSATNLFNIPENALIVEWVVNVRTAFSGGTTELDVGKSGDADYFVQDLDISSVGQASLTTEVKKPGEKMDAITAIYAQVGAGNSAGSLKLTCVFALEQETPIR